MPLSRADEVIESLSFSAAHKPAVGALLGHAATSKLSLLSGVERKLDLDPAKGRF
jgi:hypothetical protein